MLNKYIPTRRLPMGFSGEWGKCFKKFITEDNVQLNNEVVQYENNNYVDIGVDIQFKRVAEISYSEDQPIKGLIVKSYYTTLCTTDSYFDAELMQYCCSVDVGDVIKYNNKLWVVTAMQEKTKRNPDIKSFYYLDVRSI